MKPALVSETTETSKEWIDIVLALDVSGSMGADDFSPDRLSVAKSTLEKFVDELTSDRVGLVVFAGKPFTSVPLTFDYEISKQIVWQTSTETINQNVRGLNGTAIGDAILSSLWILEKWRDEADDEREQVIVLVTDGEATAWSLDPAIAAAYSVEQWVTIYTVGIWSLEWWSISYQTIAGVRKQPVWWVDERTLQAIAKQTWWKYRRATDEETFQSIFDELSELTKSEVETETIQSSTPALQWLERLILWISLLLLLLAMVFSYQTTRSDTVRKIQHGVIILLCVGWVVVLILIPSNEEVVSKQQISVVLDVSKSMQVQDVSYRNQTISRLQASKTLIQRAIDRVSDASRWMQVFAGASTTVLPVTTDRELFLTFLQWVDRDTVTEWWSDLWQAIRQAADRFVQESELLTKRILVISDGWEDEITIDAQTLEKLEENQIEVRIIWVGTTPWWPIVEWVDRLGNAITTQYQWQTVISWLGEDILQSLASQTSWEYMQFDSIDDIDWLLKEFSNEQWVFGLGRVWWGWYEFLLVLMILMSSTLTVVDEKKMAEFNLKWEFDDLAKDLDSVDPKLWNRKTILWLIYESIKNKIALIFESAEEHEGTVPSKMNYDKDE